MNTIDEDIPSSRWNGILALFFLLSQRSEIRTEITKILGDKDASKFEFCLLMLIRGFKPKHEERGGGPRNERDFQ